MQHPPRSDAAYRERAAQTVEALRSHVATARLWSEQVAAGRALHPTAAVGLEEADTGASSTATRFSAWTPPRGLGAVRTDVSAAATAVTEELGRLRIAAERDEWDVVAARRGELRALARRLTRDAAEVRR